MNRSWLCLLLVSLAAGLSACGGGETADGSGTTPPATAVPSPPVTQTPPAPPPPSSPQPPTPDPQPPTVATPDTDVGPWVLDLARGQSQFVEKCQQCHAPNGTGGYGPALTNTVTCPPCEEFTRLWKRIDEFMPFRNPEACDAACSRDIAAWITNGFSTVASCAVRFRYDSVAGQRFTATVQIENFSMRGLAVPTWRLGFTLPPDHRVTAASNAVAAQSGDQVLLNPIDSRPTIPSGAVLEIRLEGSHGGAVALPADMRLEAPPCFTALPG